MITYDYYRIFYYVAMYHSFTKAAEALGNNQPNITRCMNNLENELECKLFVRSNRGICLTPEGEQLFAHVSIAYEQLQYGEEELKKDRSLESGHITIGASETALHLMVLDKLESFHEEYPHVQLRILNHSTPQAIEALDHGLIDFAVVTTPLKIKKNNRKIVLHSFQEILLGGSKYRELGRNEQSLKEIQNFPIVSLGKDTGTWELYMKYFLKHHLTFVADMEASTMDQILPMLTHNLGIGFYPEELATEAIQTGKVFQIPLKEELPQRQVCLILDKHRPQSIAVKQILKEFME